MSNKISDQSGFTIIEILIALLLLTALISISLEIVLFSNQANEKSKAYAEANDKAFAKLQDYELRDFSDITNGSSANNYVIEDFSNEAESDSDGLLRDVEGTVRSQAISGSLKKLTVRIQYTHDGETRPIEYATYIQIDGVGR